MNTIKVFMDEGEAVLRSKLDELDIKELHKTVSANGLDYARRTARWKDRARLTEYIVTRTKATANMGQVFRHYNG